MVTNTTVRGTRAEEIYANRSLIPHDEFYVIWVGSNDLDRRYAHPQVLVRHIINTKWYLENKYRGARVYVVMVPGRFQFRHRRESYK